MLTHTRAIFIPKKKKNNSIDIKKLINIHGHPFYYTEKK